MRYVPSGGRHPPLTCGSSSVRHIRAPDASESFFGTLKNEWAHHERLTDAETTKFRTIEFIESYHDRYRPHEAIGDRVPAEAMAEFFERFEEAMSYEPELPLAA